MKKVNEIYKITERNEVLHLVENEGWTIVDLSSLLGVTVRCVQQHLSKSKVPFSFVLKIYGLMWIKENVARATSKRENLD